MQIKRALLSVSNKSDLVGLARFLSDRGVEILSTGGTARHLSEASIPVTSVASWSGAPEILGGRVKTLTPKVFGSILFDRNNADHVADCERHSIPPVDLVVVNLYPFEATISREETTLEEAIEQIDIGGPSLLRAAAKNHAHVVPLCSPSLYPEFMNEMKAGEISGEFRRRAALEVFRMTSEYDATIVRYLDRPGAALTPTESMPNTIRLELTLQQPLRYGENPQQSAAFYKRGDTGSPQWKQLQGKELSYNNLMDLDAASKLAHAYSKPCCAIIKHTNPCGAATGSTVLEAIRSAVASDPVSAFGGIIGVNRPFDLEAAMAIDSLFLEVVVAPRFTEEARAHLERKKNLRLIESQGFGSPTELRSAAGGVLIQTADVLSGNESWRTVTKRQALPHEREAMEFAWIVCAHVKSNAIVLSSERQTVGIGAGQMSRVDSARLAIMKAVLPVQSSVAASDAFFPFRDGLDLLLDAGVSAVVQPGGSVRDDEVIAAANERGITMVFTGERHFRH